MLTASKPPAVFCSSSVLSETAGGAFLVTHAFQAHGEAGPTTGQGAEGRARPQGPQAPHASVYVQELYKGTVPSQAKRPPLSLPLGVALIPRGVSKPG